MVAIDQRVRCASLVEDARPGHGEDRVAIVTLRGRTLIVVADGAGGVGGGADAAETVCRSLIEAVPEWDVWLAKMDRTLAVSAAGGLSAAVVIEIRDNGTIRGASVGDCEAWIFGDDEVRCLTERQIRKPLLGGGARPVPFAAWVPHGTVVVASDGLWKYTSQDRIMKAAKHRPLDLAAGALVGTVRMQSGTLDDVGVVVCEIKP